MYVKFIEDTCYAEAYLPADARDSFRNTLDKHCDFIRIEVGALSSMFMSILLYTNEITMFIQSIPKGITSICR